MTNLPLLQKGIVRNFVWIINLILLRIQKKIPKISQKDLSSKYDIGKATICNILKRNDEYRRQFEENIGSKRKRYVSPGKFSDLKHVFEMQVSPLDASLSSEAKDPDDNIPLNELVQRIQSSDPSVSHDDIEEFNDNFIMESIFDDEWESDLLLKFTRDTISSQSLDNETDSVD
jgi:hypothetical protein